MYPINSMPENAFSLMVLSLFMLCVVTMMLGSMLASESVLGLRRNYWQRRLVGTRLARMLARRGLAPGLFIDTGSGSEIRYALRVCRGCTKQARCDEVLSDEHVTAMMLAFCPNAASIERIAKTVS